MFPDATVLLIEDHRTTAEAMSETLADDGYRVLLARSVAEARERLQSHDVDVAVVDVHLPDGHGLTLLEELHQDDQAIPALFVSSDDRSVIRDRAQALSGCRFLRKPYDPDRLVTVVRSLLDNSAAPA